MTIRKGTIQMTRLKTNLNFCLGLGTLLLLAGCASEPKEFEYKNLTEEVEAIKADGGIYKVGNPYTVMGQSYTPREDYGYVETGMASWYGDDFHNKRTANGVLSISFCTETTFAEIDALYEALLRHKNTRFPML